ncbi:MAG: hypothetical protein QJR05_09125 [Thermoanaerobacterium sp.]|nr:hypothetical protein [Thermoanaerobacterium sp.]
MVSKKYKTFFFLSLFVYILAYSIINSTINRGYILSSINKHLSSGQMIIAIITGTAISIFTLFIFLVLARLLLVFLFKIIYKNNVDENFLNEIYFTSAGLKLLISMITVLTLISGTTLGWIIANAVAILLYFIFVFFNKVNIDVKRSRKKIIIQSVVGALVILFI